MKKLLVSFFTLTLLFCGFSCTSDDGSDGDLSAAQQLNTTLSSGTWHITLFKEDDNDQTTNFTDYNFIFGAADVLTATNGDNTYVGYWGVGLDDSGVDLDIDFSAPANFTELTEDWDILERTNTKVRLRHVSGGDGSIDLLTFEKN